MNSTTAILDLVKHLKLINLNWKKQFRIIPSKFPPINFFEKLVDPHQMEALFVIESLTNDRLREEVGDLSLVKPEDRISGPGSSIVMAAFTHIGNPTRFSDGSFGVYYASKEIKTAIKETIYRRSQFLSYTAEKPGNITMRVYCGKILKPLHDIRTEHYKILHHPEEYHLSQNFGADLKKLNSWGMVYRSVRDAGGECIAALRPPAISIPVQTKHLIYEWNGNEIARVYEPNTLYEKT
jgi:RES domain